MKNLKKSLSVLLAVSMIVSIFAMCGVNVFAEEITSGKCGENAFWEYDASTKTITVSGSGSAGSSAQWDDLYFENFIVEDGITYLHMDTLNGVESVKYVKISGSVKCITDYAITNCPNLKNIDLEYGIESLEVGPFANNPALESVNIPGSVKTFMICTFANCSSLKNVVLEEGVEEITNAMFLDCVSLTNITLPESVKIIYAEAFSGCKSLKKIEISEAVKEIGENAFADCSSMEEIYIYNKNCVIDFDENTIPSTAVIYGYTDSVAETYAKQYNRKFVALDDDLISIFTRFFRSFADFIRSLYNYFMRIF